MNEHFSPKLENHAAATAFNYFAYTFHQDSSYTSHVSSDGRWGVTDRLWNVALWEAYELERGKSGMTITIAERIKNFLIEHEGKPYCDNCIAGQLRLMRRQHAEQATLTFGNTGNFRREKGLCFECKKDRHVVRFSK